MQSDALRRRLMRALMVALAAPAGACCKVTETQREVHEGAPGVYLFGAAATCESVCSYGQFCSVAPLVSCTMTGAVGSRVATCVHEETDCPQRPGEYATCGRRCEGATHEPHAPCDDPLGALFATTAALEAESVPAFERLATELTAHGAPPSLVRAAERAANDERRHARAMGDLARAHGAEPPALRALPLAPRSLLDVALENAREGCVRETFGALVAQWQAARAGDPRVRAVMRGIAGDELRHAALGWRVDAWARARLPGEQRARLQQARGEAVEALRSSLGPVEARSAERAGVPTHAEALRLLAACEAHVWQRAAA